MSFLFGDSFDYYLTADELLKWTNFAQVDQPGATCNITASALNNGIAGMRFTIVNAGFGVESFNLNKTLGPGDNTFVHGFAFRYSAAQGGAGTQNIGIAACKDISSVQCQLLLNQDGTLSIARGNASGFTPPVVLGTTVSALLANTFYHIAWKVKVHSSTGTAAIKINNISVLSLTGQNTQNTANATWNVLSIGLQQIVNLGFTSGTNLDYDDIYVCDGVSPNNDFLGVVAVGAIHAEAGNGADTDFTTSAGADHGALVDETYQDGDTTYNTSSTSGHKDTYTLENVSTGLTIKCVQSVMVARKTDAGGRTVANIFHIGATDYFGANIAPVQTYTQLLTPYDVSPATAVAFTATEVNAMQGGIKVTA